jgi:hypothetical protein
MVRNRWRAFLILYTVACFNKETTILLTMVFTLHFFGRGSRMSWKHYFQLLGLQLGIFFLIRLLITWIFRNNPGAPLEFHLLDHNVALLLRPYGYTPLAVILCVTLLVFYRWTEKPPFLRNGLSILIPLAGMTLLFGYLDELRDFYEVYPVLLLLAAHTVASILQIPIQTLPEPEPIGQNI